MSEAEPTQAELYEAYLDRVYNEDIGPVTVRPADWTTSPEALDILTDQGVDAYRQWLLEHAPDHSP